MIGNEKAINEQLTEFVEVEHYLKEAVFQLACGVLNNIPTLVEHKSEPFKSGMEFTVNNRHFEVVMTVKEEELDHDE